MHDNYEVGDADADDGDRQRGVQREDVAGAETERPRPHVVRELPHLPPLLSRCHIPDMFRSRVEYPLQLKVCSGNTQIRIQKGRYVFKFRLILSCSNNNLPFKNKTFSIDGSIFMKRSQGSFSLRKP